jgi:hypothetical protein
MSFLSNNIGIETPSGSVIAFLGTNDPEGWVICDGVARVYNAKYAGVVTLGIGTKNTGANTYTPPDLSAKMLRGGTPKSIGGSDTVTLSTANLPSHNHSIEQHAHTIEQHDHTVTGHTHTVPAHSHSVLNHSHNMQHRHQLDMFHDDDNWNYTASDAQASIRPYKDANSTSGSFATIAYTRTSGLFSQDDWTSSITNTGLGGSQTLSQAVQTSGNNGEATTVIGGPTGTGTGGPIASGSVGSATPIETIPAYFGANWILKL